MTPSLFLDGQQPPEQARRFPFYGSPIISEIPDVICFAAPLCMVDPVTGMPRSPGWPPARLAHLKRQPECQISGRRTDLEVHHIVPFHVDPSRELDPDNLVTLSAHDHFVWGHGCNWRNVNPDVLKDCERAKTVRGIIRLTAASAVADSSVET